MCVCVCVCVCACACACTHLMQRMFPACMRACACEFLCLHTISADSAFGLHVLEEQTAGGARVL